MKSGVVTQQSFSGKKTVKMFFKLALLCSILSCALAAPTATDVVPLEKQQPTVIPIVSQSDELETNGTYKFSYETGNGIKREEISYEKVIPIARSADSKEGDSSNESNEIHVQQGSYSYVAPDGTVISVKYIADENGFRPVGDHLPRAPVLVPQSQGNSGEKSGRALKQRIKEDQSSSESKVVETPKEISSEEKVNAAASENAVSTEKKSVEAPANGVPEKSDKSTIAAAEVTSKAEPEATSVSTTEAVSATEAATTAAVKDVPVSTTVTVTEVASTTEAVSTTEAATTAVTQGAPEKTTAVPTTEASSALEAASTKAATSVEAEPSPAQLNSESSGSTTTEEASSSTSP